ncbi:MAG TPA: MFS transporter [Candidatus Binatia bacterium]|nr:MFS transporter [Candidatus Binatia bacterium]
MTQDRLLDSESPQEEKLDFKKILPIFVIVFVDLLGLTIIIPLLPLYATSFGADPFLIGVLGAAYPLMQFIGAPVLGRFSDRLGRKPVLIVSQIGTFTGFLLLGFAHGLWLLFLARIVDGISGANISTAQAAISDSTSEETRTQGLGLIGAAFGLGFIIGPVIAFISLAATNNNYHVPAFVAAVLSLISILLTSFWLEETLDRNEGGEQQEQAALSLQRMWRAARNPAVGILVLLMFAQQLAFGGFEQILSLFTLSRLGLNASGNAVIFVFVGVIVVAVQGGFIGKWSRRYGDRKLILAGLGLLAVGLVSIAFTPERAVPWYERAALQAELTSQGDGGLAASSSTSTSDVPIELPEQGSAGWAGLGWILVAMVPVAIGGGILQPAINSLITKRSDPNKVGAMLGISASFLSAANAVAPLIGGALFSALGATAPFVAWGVLMAFLVGSALRLIAPDRQESTGAGAAGGVSH